jgi:hypothetical protein
VDIEAQNVAIYLPHIAGTDTTTSDERQQYAPPSPNLVLIGVLLSSLLGWWALLIYAFSALASALIF